MIIAAVSIVLNLVHGGMSRRGRKKEYSGKCAQQLIFWYFLCEFLLMKILTTRKFVQFFLVPVTL